MEKESLQGLIRNIPDFPKKGILFRDITPLLADGPSFRSAVDILASACPAGTQAVAGIESRGFIFGAGVANSLGVGFVPIRKSGKLPYRTEKITYALEYGTDNLEVHQDALAGRNNVVLVDDLLATGGTAEAACGLLEKIGGKILKVIFLIELADLKGRQKISGYDTFSLLVFD
ncbi:MAG: adenine phosphoribosyltransferase [Candidatus Omnitrophota bacterium]